MEETDVTKSDQVDRMVKRIIEEYGHIDMLINNAEGFSSGLVVNFQEDEWDWTTAVNLNNTLAKISLKMNSNSYQ